MPELIFLFNTPPYIDLPAEPTGWLGLLVLLGFEIYLLWQWRKYQRSWDRNRLWEVILGVILVPLTSFVIPGIRLHAAGALPPPLLPIEPSGPVLMLFSALPWFLAAGLSGPVVASGLAFLSGVFLALWSSHDLFLPLELAILATILSAGLRQRYRTFLFELLRNPIVVSILLVPIYSGLTMISAVLTAQGVLASRLDFALTHLYISAFAFGITFLTGGIFAYIVAKAVPGLWNHEASLKPSPFESRLASRFVYRLVPITVLLAIVLMVADWKVAGRVARQMLEGRMSNAGQMSAQTVPFILETGQNLISQLAEDSNFLREEQTNSINDLRLVPYFNQLLLVNSDYQLLASYPHVEDSFILSPIEESGVDLAMNLRVPNQFYVVPPEGSASAAQISFITPVQENGNVERVLIGRTDLASNPLAQPVLTSLDSVVAIGGTGMLLDENGTILYHPDPNMVMESYSEALGEEAVFYEGTGTDGTRQLIYFQPIVGRSWGVLLMVPARFVQQQAMEVAAPILLIIVFLALGVVLFVPLGFRSVTSSLNSLAIEAQRISGGNLDRSLEVDGEDEIGQLSRTFEHMRKSLKSRLEELSLLLKVSQAVASTLEIDRSLQPVLESALVTGASSARVILAPAVVPEFDGDTRADRGFGTGPMSDLYRNLDEQILKLISQQDRLLLNNLTRPRLLDFTPGFPRPQAILGMALRHEKQFYGALWLAYDQSHPFEDEEVNFVATLAGQAAMAAANANLFQSAEIGRQRLGAILASSPDPILVTDQHHHLLLANPAAWQVLGIELETGRGKPVAEVISLESLANFLTTGEQEDKSIELVVPDGRVFLASASTVTIDGHAMGRVCLLSDVTHFKKLEVLKSEFVSTVSHDLRSPLTLIRGYATMLQMVGELNEQQTGYIRKILSGVESMSRLVNNLLDLSRIEAGVGLQIEKLSVHDIVEDVVGEMQMQAAQKRIQLQVEIPKNINPIIEADPALLQQALHNLVENAIKYTELAGQVIVQLRVHQDQMVFEIHDTGMGIAPADQQRLFEKFYRARRKGAKGERGSGLGLAIVKSIAERHGGRVWLKSQLGKGSTFYFAIPISQPTGEVENVR